MLQIRRSSERGQANYGWLKTRYSFSFGEYRDPAHDGFRSLRVINEDHVAPGAGFPMHPHRNMEILTYILEGSLEHKDSMGNGSVIRAGEFQRMNAGSGVFHSEFNPSKSDPVHLLQIWLLPDRGGNPPEYDQRYFEDDRRENRLCLIASPDGDQRSFRIYQDAKLFHARLEAGKTLEAALDPERFAWVQVAKGSLQVNGSELEAGDGARIAKASSLELLARDSAEILLFDLA